MSDTHTAGRIAELDHLLDLVPTFVGFGATLQPILERRRDKLVADAFGPKNSGTNHTAE